MAPELIIFIIVVVLILAIIYMYYFNNTKEGFESKTPGLYDAKKGTTPTSEGYTPGDVVKVSYFFKPRCPSCIAYNPVFEKIQSRVKNSFPHVDIDKYDITLPEHYEEMCEITGTEFNTVPCVVLFYGGGKKLLLDSRKRNNIMEYIQYTKM